MAGFITRNETATCGYHHNEEQLSMLGMKWNFYYTGMK